MSSPSETKSFVGSLRKERSLLVGLITLALFFAYGNDWLSSMSGWLVPVTLFCWLFLSMLWLAFGVVHHADGLAIRLGEPYGTLILTLSVISIEVVMISAVMLAGAQSPEIGRDMMFAVLMIVLNGLIGLCLLCGGLRHLEQVYNLQGANTFLIVLIPLSLLSLILPNFTESSDRGTYSTGQMVFAVAASAGLYGAFLIAQTLRHRGFFTAAEDKPAHDHGGFPLSSVGVHACLLLANMLPIVLLSKSMAKVIDYHISALAAPAALGGLFIAVLVLAPEGLAAQPNAAPAGIGPANDSSLQLP